MSEYTEAELLTLAKDILAKPGAMSEQDVRELDEIGREFARRRTAGTTKILDSGALLCTTPGIKTVSKTATLPIGNYIYVQSADDSGVQVDALNLPGLSGLINVGVTRTFQAANPTVAGVLPSTLGALTADSIFLAMAIALFQT